MAEKDESSLIGYDPLAWLHQQAEQQQIPPASVECPDGEEQSVDDRAGAEVPSGAEITDSEWQGVAFEAGDDGVAGDRVTIVLEPVLSIHAVAQLHGRLLSALNDNNKIEIDASAVTVVDTASLQLLLILKLTAIKEQKTVVIDFPSEKFIEAANLLGISEMLGVDQAAAGFF